MNKMGAVISFTYRNKVKTKAFRWTTILLALLIIIGLNIPYAIQLFSGSSSDGTIRIGIASGQYNDIADDIRQASDEAQQIVAHSASGMTNGSTVNSMNTGASSALAGSTDEDIPTKLTWNNKPQAVAQLNQQLEQKELDGYLLLRSGTGTDKEAFPTVTYVSDNDDSTVQAILQGAAQAVKLRTIAAGQLSDEQLTELGSPVTVGTVSPDKLNGGAAADKPFSVENFILVYMLMVLFFISLTMTGNMVAAEITAEKSSRVMEILITSVSPLTQMFGKIIGIFLVGLTQMGIYALVFGIHLTLPYYQHVLSQFDLHVSNLSWEVAVFGFIYYILGYFLYSTLYAAVGSIVSRTEDLGQAVSLLTVLTLAAFYIGIFSISKPDTLLVRIASYIPFFSPTTSLIRLGLGNMAWWEIAISMLILLVSIVICGWISAKIYRTGVLMYGKRPTWKELRKAMKAYKI
ncbi:ABC transporter permease [Paenibacillus sp. WLX2291]|uniref:ABC transporter permease n=1 Tax=Paenibacillus sp. WLX2291 TaxID=3296934 RepID=UPI0039842922